MPTKDTKIEDIIRFQQDTGSIYLKNTRMVLVNADSIGKLREDLISTLGIERAKGFLIRYGWSWGYNDGFIFKDEMLQDDEEWIMSGPRLHMLEGNSKIDILEFNADRNKSIWYLKGRWINSFEAEQHLKTFGIVDEPVCWILLGYAGGYGTALLGEKVIYKETKCIGKGDPYCEFEGKTIAEWGTEIEDQLPYYEEDKINEELKAAYNKIKLQDSQKKKNVDIRQRLTNIIVEGKGINEVTKILSEIINSTIFVFDKNVDLMAMHFPKNQLVELKFQESIRNYLRKITYSSNVKEYNQLIDKKIPVKKSFVIDEVEYKVVIVPIIGNLEVLGLIAFVHNFDKETEADSTMIIQHSSIIYALEIIKEKNIMNLEQEVRGDFIYSLVYGNYADEKLMIEWSLRLGQDIRKLRYIMVLKFDNYRNKQIGSESENNIWHRKELFRITKTFLDMYYPNSFCGMVNEKIIILVASAKEEMRDKHIILDIYSRLKHTIQQFFTEISISAGIGTKVNSIDEFKNSYKEAISTLELMERMSKQDKINFYDDIGSLSLLVGAQNPDELMNFMNKKLGVLLEYDNKHNTELIETLENYYLCNNNIQATAKKIIISLSGIKYRLNKIKELGYNINSSRENFDLQLAINIYRLFSD